MDLRQLRYFTAVAERHSFNGASEALHIAQSALSRHIAALEEEVGGPLFERLARGVSLTAAGELLLQRAKLILSQVQDAQSELLAHHGELRGTVRLAAPSSLSQRLYAPLVNHFLELYPKVELQLSEGTTQAVISRLAEGSLDIGLVTNPPPNKHMEFEFLMEEPIVLVGRGGDPLLAKRTVPPQLLASLPLMMATGVGRILGKWGSDLRPVLLVDSTNPMKALVLSGRGYALMPICSVRGEAASDELAFAIVRGTAMTRMLAVHRGRPASRASLHVMKQLRLEVARLADDAPGPAQRKTR
jgi:LysR family transcriptional regulator, nitrogen assimilation regulatory protein